MTTPRLTFVTALSRFQRRLIDACDTETARGMEMVLSAFRLFVYVVYFFMESLRRSCFPSLLNEEGPVFDILAFTPPAPDIALSLEHTIRLSDTIQYYTMHI